MNKYTKGPWTVSGESTLNIISFDTPKGRKVCSLLSQNIEDQANASLIAAAPELLEALQRVNQCFYSQYKDLKSEEIEVLKHVRSLIAKATGGAK